MTKEPLVSVVLPIYNVEKYLDRCVNSIVNQTYRNLEIIMVDDGSPDNCPNMCDDWAKKDARVKVVHKQNEGLGMARNTGIDNATGDYICFFDSDDYVSLNVIEKSVALAEKEAADVVIFGLNAVSSNGEIVRSFSPCAKPETYEGSDVTEVFLPEYTAPDPHRRGPRKFYMSSCVSIYSLKMIKSSDWRFVSERDIISEDVYSLLGLFVHVRKVAVLPEALYYYCDNNASLSRAYKPNRYERIKHFYLESVKLCKKLGYNDFVIHQVSKPYLAFTIAALKQEYVAPKSKKESKASIRSIINDDVLQRVLKENKNDIVGTNRSVLYFAMRNKLYGLCFLLLKMKT